MMYRFLIYLSLLEIASLTQETLKVCLGTYLLKNNQLQKFVQKSSTSCAHDQVHKLSMPTAYQIKTVVPRLEVELFVPVCKILG